MKEIRNPKCDLCKLHLGASTVCVPGEGSGRLPVMILGEAPGQEEDSRGRPFVGASGKLLRSELLKAGLPLKRTYITNSVKCYPHGTPSELQIRKCSSVYLKNEIALLQPSYILTLGRVALGSIVPGWELKDVKGQILESWMNDALVFPIWHPAYILRNRGKLNEWRVDIENFVALLEVDLGNLR